MSFDRRRTATHRCRVEAVARTVEIASCTERHSDGDTKIPPHNGFLRASTVAFERPQTTRNPSTLRFTLVPWNNGPEKMRQGRSDAQDHEPTILNRLLVKIWPRTEKHLVRFSSVRLRCEEHVSGDVIDGFPVGGGVTVGGGSGRDAMWIT